MCSSAFQPCIFPFSMCTRWQLIYHTVVRGSAHISAFCFKLSTAVALGSEVSGPRTLPASLFRLQINTTTLNCTHWETVIREWRQTHTRMHRGRTFCWNNRCCDNGTRGQRNEGDLSLAQNESTLRLWTFRSQHLHPQLFHVCVCLHSVASFETECLLNVLK